MGHRRLYSSASMPEIHHDQNSNQMHPVQTNIHLAEKTSFVYPAEHMSVDGVRPSPHWESAPRPNGYPSASVNFEAIYHQPDGSGPSHDPYLHPPACGIFYTLPENSVHPSYSSNFDRHREMVHGFEGGFVDLKMNNGRWAGKRKSHEISGFDERGTTSKYYGAGSSSDISMATDILQEKPNTDTQQHWEKITEPSYYPGDRPSFMDEFSSRNVRPRTALEIQSNLPSVHLPTNEADRHYSTSHITNHYNSMEITGQSSSATNRYWNHTHASSASHGTVIDTDTSGTSHPTDDFFVWRSTRNVPIHMRNDVHPHYLNSSINQIVPPNFQCPSAPAVGRVHRGYSQRGSFRASSSSLHIGQMPSSDDRRQLVAENYTHRHHKPRSSSGWRNNDSNRRPSICNDRHSSMYVNPVVCDRLASEGLVILDRTNLHGSTNMLDQHSDMRLDIDNMSYEELLALEESIGNVNTGLSIDLISKCLTRTIYTSSNQNEEERCVICLEEYKSTDDIGSLRSCGHDYHVPCIKQWLMMKNSCPICKASALVDKAEKSSICFMPGSH